MIPVFVVRYRLPEVEEECLRCLNMYSDATHIETIVYDNGPTNECLATVWNRLIFSYTAWNDNDPIGVLLNSDCFVTSGWHSLLERAIQSSDRIGFAGPMTDNSQNSNQLAPESYDPRNYEGEITRVKMISGFCLMFRLKALKDAGGFAEDGPFYGQETALIWKACAMGWEAVIARDCWVQHLGSASLRASESRGEANIASERRIGKAWFRLFQKKNKDKLHQENLRSI